MYGPQAALIAEGFTPRLRYSGCSIGYQLCLDHRPGYVIAGYIAICAVISIVAIAFMSDYTGRDISQESA